MGFINAKKVAHPFSVVFQTFHLMLYGTVRTGQIHLNPISIRGGADYTHSITNCVPPPGPPRCPDLPPYYGPFLFYIQTTRILAIYSVQKIFGRTRKYFRMTKQSLMPNVKMFLQRSGIKPFSDFF